MWEHRRRKGDEGEEEERGRGNFDYWRNSNNQKWWILDVHIFTCCPALQWSHFEFVKYLYIFPQNCKVSPLFTAFCCSWCLFGPSKNKTKSNCCWSGEASLLLIRPEWLKWWGKSTCGDITKGHFFHKYKQVQAGLLAKFTSRQEATSTLGR